MSVCAAQPRKQLLLAMEHMSDEVREHYIEDHFLKAFERAGKKDDRSTPVIALKVKDIWYLDKPDKFDDYRLTEIEILEKIRTNSTSEVYFDITDITIAQAEASNYLILFMVGVLSFGSWIFNAMSKVRFMKERSWKFSVFLRTKWFGLLCFTSATCGWTNRKDAASH